MFFFLNADLNISSNNIVVDYSPLILMDASVAIDTSTNSIVSINLFLIHQVDASYCYPNYRIRLLR